MTSWETAPAIPSAAESLASPSQVAWERLPGETDLAFSAFQDYRDMGPARSVPKLTDMGHSHSSVKKWQSRWAWIERARRFDEHMDRIRQDRYITGIEEMAHRHARDAAKTIKALMVPIDALVDALETHPEQLFEKLDGTDIRRIIDLAQKSARVLQPMMSAERTAKGLPTEITRKEEEHVVSIDYGDPERLAATLEALAGTGVLDALMAAGGARPFIDAEVVEVDTGEAVAETDSLPARAAS